MGSQTQSRILTIQNGHVNC
uniref:Uncharacterized protein n=1 Tax=Anguilla anguilla TaxID=7936 RepID=A0A0E9XL77_ANGAN